LIEVNAMTDNLLQLKQNPAFETPEFQQYWDAWTMRHFNAWLENYVNGDTCREEVREAMLTLAATDPEWWSCNSYTLLFDRAKCDRIVVKYM
jgi:hypothetical protein